MGQVQVKYDSIVVNYDRRGFIRLATDLYRSDAGQRDEEGDEDDDGREDFAGDPEAAKHVPEFVHQARDDALETAHLQCGQIGQI